MSRNTTKLAIIITLIALLPLGDPFDFIILPGLIAAIGIELYVVLSIIAVFYLYNAIEGKTIKDKIKNIKKELKW